MARRKAPPETSLPLLHVVLMVVPRKLVVTSSIDCVATPTVIAGSAAAATPGADNAAPTAHNSAIGMRQLSTPPEPRDDERDQTGGDDARLCAVVSMLAIPLSPLWVQRRRGP
jgi:hypothetical protein